MFSLEYCEIFKNSYFYRTPLVAASDFYPYVTYERGNNKIRLQVKFTGFKSLRKRKQYVYSQIWY